MDPSEPAPPPPPQPPPSPLLSGLDPEKLLAAALRSSPVTAPAHDWEPPPPEEVDAWFPEYTVDRLLGRGAMGAVYHAAQQRLGRETAIKLLPAALAAQPEMTARFEREARALARLSHPNIVTLHDFGRTAGGHLFIVMEYVEGADLRRIIAGGEMTVPQALEITTQVCEALQYAHSRGVVHRDIKPGNILVDTAGRARIADFGLTKLLHSDTGAGAAAAGEHDHRTLTGASLGTPEYTAPEQLRGGVVDHRADIYSLGVMLYEMLTGELPRGAWEPPSRKKSDADARLDEVVTRAMQNEPDKRYQHASEVNTAVRAAREPVPSAAAADSSGSAGDFKKNTALALVLLAAAAWIARMLPTGIPRSGLLVWGPCAAAAVWFLARPRKTGVMRWILSGLVVAWAAALTVTLLLEDPHSTDDFAKPQPQPPANARAESVPGGESSAARMEQAKAKVARILSGIEDTVRAQETIVERQREKLLELMKRHGIIDAAVFPAGAAPGIVPSAVAEGAEGSDQIIRRMQLDSANLADKSKTIANLPDEEKWRAIAAIGDDATIKAFYPDYRKSKFELAQMATGGFGARHPKMEGLTNGISQMETLMREATKNYERNLETNLANLQNALETAIRQEAQGGARSADPETMRKYTEEKVRYDIALETLNKLRESALELTKGALNAFQREVEHIAEAAPPAAAAPLPEPPAPPPSGEK